MSKECENCIKRKTMWCPASIECMALDELPYYLDKISALKKIDNLQQENKQLKEKLENKIDLYEDTISYQLGFDKGKEYMQQRIDKAIEWIKEDYDGGYFECGENDIKKLLEILGDKENEET